MLEISNFTFFKEKIFFLKKIGNILLYEKKYSKLINY